MCAMAASSKTEKRIQGNRTEKWGARSCRSTEKKWVNITQAEEEGYFVTTYLPTSLGACELCDASSEHYE